MKRLFTLFTGLCVMLLAGCNDEYDDSALVKRLDDFEQRLERLERLCNDMNTNLGSMQTIVTALDRGDYITSVEPLTENGSMVGYTIRFAKGTPIVVYNGKPGTAPVVSVKKDTDGIYYWTLDGEWITDGGKKLPVSGQNGTSPKLKIEEEYWYISYDDGTTWTKLDKATGEIVTLSDLFRPDADYVSVLSAEVLRQMEEQMAADASLSYLTDEFTAIDPEQSFYWNADGDLVLVFDEYTVAAGYMGMVEFTIPRDVYSALLK